jgi:hypothetical protein
MQEASGASGCTCTVVAVDRGTRRVTCANVGDSAAVLVLKGSVVPLTADHRLENNAEECVSSLSVSSPSPPHSVSHPYPFPSPLHAHTPTPYLPTTPAHTPRPSPLAPLHPSHPSPLTPHPLPLTRVPTRRTLKPAPKATAPKASPGMRQVRVTPMAILTTIRCERVLRCGGMISRAVDASGGPAGPLRGFPGDKPPLTTAASSHTTR